MCGRICGHIWSYCVDSSFSRGGGLLLISLPVHKYIHINLSQWNVHLYSPTVKVIVTRWTCKQRSSWWVSLSIFVAYYVLMCKDVCVLCVNVCGEV